MKYVLIKYKNIKILVNDSCDMQPIMDHLERIDALNKKVSGFYMNLMNANQDLSSSIEYDRQQIISKIGYNIIGVPFTNHDAELYAIDKKLEYTELHLNVDIEYERINVDVEKPIKTLAVRHVNNSEHKNLAKYIEYLIKKDLGI
jgi:hypothetical protein